MSILDRYRDLFEHEKDCNAKMLSMIESVPASNRNDPRFQRAVSLAGHITACRENWLDRMHANGISQVDWYDKRCELETLRPRFKSMEGKWTEYLANLTDKELANEFVFPGGDGNRYRWLTEGQIKQLVGHAAYHRGQIALLVDELGGETMDTDYLYWAIPQDPRYGKITDDEEK